MQQMMQMIQLLSRDMTELQRKEKDPIKYMFKIENRVASGQTQQLKTGSK